MTSIIINGFDNDIATELILNNPFDKTFYIGEKQLFTLSNNNVHTYNCFDFPIAKYPNDFIKTEPLDEKIIKEFSECETIVLKMFERNNFWFEASYDQRKEWYLIHLRYWYDIINKYNVVCYLGSNFPHEMYDYIIVSILKHKKAKTFFFTQLSFMNRALLETDIYTYDRLKSFLTTQPKNEIVKEVKNYLEEIRKPAINFTKPFYMKTTDNRGTLKKQHEILKVYNKKFAVKPNYNEHYFFLPLHYQPELTTCPLAGEYVNQNLIIELLDYYLPKNILLYIKEHPKQTIVARSTEFYRKYSEYERVRFITTDTNSIELTDNSIAVVTCTGTAGQEALIRRKPVIIFGNTFYQFCPNCFAVKSKDEVQKAISTILSGVVFSDSDISSFFQMIYDYTYNICIDSNWANEIKLTKKENNESIIKIINKEVFMAFHNKGDK